MGCSKSKIPNSGPPEPKGKEESLQNESSMSLSTRSGAGADGARSGRSSRTRGERTKSGDNHTESTSFMTSEQWKAYRRMDPQIQKKEDERPSSVRRIRLPILANQQLDEERRADAREQQPRSTEYVDRSTEYVERPTARTQLDRRSQRSRLGQPSSSPSPALVGQDRSSSLPRRDSSQPAATDMYEPHSGLQTIQLSANYLPPALLPSLPAGTSPPRIVKDSISPEGTYVAEDLKADPEVWIDPSADQVTVRKLHERAADIHRYVRPSRLSSGSRSSSSSSKNSAARHGGRLREGTRNLGAIPASPSGGRFGTMSSRSSERSLVDAASPRGAGMSGTRGSERDILLRTRSEEL